MKWALGRGGQGLEEWHLALPKITIDINMRMLPVLGVTPSQAFFGFNPVHSRDAEELSQPAFTEAQVEEFQNDDDQDDVLWSAAVLAHMDRRDEVREQLADRRVKDAESHESKKSIPGVVLPKGTWVWEKRDKPGDEHSKFKPVWKGLYVIVKPASAVSYFIRPVMGDSKIR
jgi:hypothetical protein